MSVGGAHSTSCKWCHAQLRGSFTKQRLLDRLANHLRECKVFAGAISKVNADNVRTNPDFVPRSLERAIELFITAAGGKYTPPVPPLPPLPKAA